MTFLADYPGAIVVQARNYGYVVGGKHLLNNPKAWCLGGDGFRLRDAVIQSPCVEGAHLGPKPLSLLTLGIGQRDGATATKPALLHEAQGEFGVRLLGYEVREHRQQRFTDLPPSGQIPLAGDGPSLQATDIIDTASEHFPQVIERTDIAVGRPKLGVITNRRTGFSGLTACNFNASFAVNEASRPSAIGWCSHVYRIHQRQ